ncbi:MULTISPECIES: oxamate carbamoyltransferase subunit AllG family protein [unclassified Streptomyces]|uniref:DUF1116 domain-containing protein n=1 Tax=unclassified Streptomyces TaxID=2593676 RepID=UPI003D8B5A06
MTIASPTVSLPHQVEVVNVGLPLFADSVRDQDRPVQHVDWRIPAGGNLDAVKALQSLYGDRAAAIDEANAEVVRRLDQGVPFLVEVSRASEVVLGFDGRTIVHCGPPIDWTDVCDPLRRSIRAAVVAEGWADDVEQAHRLVERGEVRLEPANHHAMVVPMATAIGPSAPVFVVENEQGGTRAFSPINQGPGEVAWFGRETDAAIERLRFLRDVAGPLLSWTVRRTGPIDLLALASQGIQMGDDLHMRTQATTNLLTRNLLPYIAEYEGPGRVEFARYLSGNHLFFLNLAMASAKSLTLWAEQVQGSSIVTSMARNGTTFGIRVAGSDHWYITEAPPVEDALYYSGYGPETSARDIGDSAVLELMGLGGPAAAGSPAVAAFLGGTMADALKATEAMAAICAGASSRFKLPPLDFQGTPVGVDLRRVVELGITPKVNTGVLHVSSGIGQVGAGVATAPVACFVEALLDLAARTS